MQLATTSWPDVASYLERSTGIIVPVGSTEQHGLNGLIGTDHLCAEAIAARAGETADIMVAPTLAYGMAQFNLGHPGTISIRASTLSALALDIIQSLTRTGFRHVYFLNGHGGNIYPIRAAIQDVLSDYSLGRMGDAAAPRCRLRSWWEYTEADALRQDLYGSWEGLHVTPSEVAVTMAVHPGKVGMRPEPEPTAITAAFARDHGGDNHFDADTHKALFPDGRIGSDPSLATARDGERLLGKAADGAVADFKAFLTEI
jgi:creatinine amidohydrolase